MANTTMRDTSVQGRLSSLEFKLITVQKQISSTKSSTIKHDPVGFHMSPSDSISMAAAFIALCALFATSWQAYLAWKHNRLSVRPHIEILRNLTDTSPLSFEITNHGPGPAIIDKIFFEVDDKQFNMKTADDIINFSTLLGLNRLDIDPKFTLSTEETILGPNSTLTPVIFLNSHLNPTTHSYIFNIIKTLTINVEYKCLYGYKYHRKLTPFDL